jgi:hypothetical protein
LGRNTRGEKELSQLQQIRKENDRLKREVSNLRKQLARLDLDRHSYVHEIVQEHLAKEDAEETTMQMLQRLKNEWKCERCGIGFLEINLYSKAGDAWYYRKCCNVNCDHRTIGKKYSKEVRGIIKDDPKNSK